ncbi:MAG: hypothetical protein QM666_09730, partial [Acinetobacter sp.]
MSLNFTSHVHKTFKCIIGIGFVVTTSVQASHSELCASSKPALLCQANTELQRTQLTRLLFTAHLISNAPTRLIQDTQSMWNQRIQQCKNKQCITSQFQQRTEALNAFSSLNQSLTQHFIKY